MADAIGAAIGRTVRFVDLGPGEFADRLRAVLPEWQVEGLLEDYAHYARGEAEQVHPTVADVTGQPARTVADFARDHADAFR